MFLQKRIQKKASPLPLASRGSKAALVFFTIVVLIACGLYLRYEWEKYDESASKEAIQLAQSLESLLHPQHVQELSGSPEDIGKPEYEMAKTGLMRLVDTTNPVHFAYLMAEQNGNLVFLMDSESPGSPDYSPPGQVYEEADDWAWAPFRTGKTVITPPVTDRWGTWISVFVPVVNPRQSETIAVFGVDYAASEWFAAIWQQMIPDIMVAVVFLLLYLALLYIMLQHARLNKLNRSLAFDEALYHGVFTQAPIGIAIVSDKNFIQESSFVKSTMNPRFEEILGRTSSELASLKWPEITHPGDLEADLAKFEQFKRGEISGYKMEKRFIRPDGSPVWTLMIISPLFGVYDDHSIHLCLIEDITRRKESEFALVESEKEFRTIAENMSDVVWQSDLELQFKYISPSAKWVLGVSAQELMRKDLKELFPRPTLRKIRSVLSEELEKEKDPQADKNHSRTIEAEHYKADGTTVWVEMSVSFLRDKQGNITGVQGSSRDITKRRLAEMALKETLRRESVLLANLPGLAYRCRFDRSGTMLIVSEGCYDLTGYRPECFIHNRDLPFNDIITPEYRDLLWAEWQRAVPARLPYRCEYEITTATGSRKWVLEAGQGVYNDKGEAEALEGIIIDITDRKEMENRLRYINEHDRLTGLNNREHLEYFLIKDIMKRDGLKRALISIDLNNVQLLTANYGFRYTQNLIREVAEALGQYATDKRLLFQAYEKLFVFYLIGYRDKSELLDFAKAIAQRLESLFAAERVGGGIGLLEIEQHDNENDVDLLLRRLLIASEKSMAVSGKDFGVYFYDEELEAVVNREGDIRKTLARIAVEDTGNQLYLQYQPVLDLRTNTVCGFEALARLNTETTGPVSPVEFIPIAEKTKLILPIGEKVIIIALRFVNKLKEHGYTGLLISINVSVIQLLDPDFSDRLLELMAKAGVDPENIGIEITESVFVYDHKNINHILEKLRSAGVHIAIDDFGTGYSSLATENQLKVDCLKIDKFFIDSLLEADPNTAIASDIISMSHKLGHCALAEGVEHERQLQYLREHHCDRVQGFLISKPLDGQDALAFLRTHEKGRFHSGGGQN
jgi:PAS domain S-box-containing protein